MQSYIALFISRRKEFFKENTYIDCSIDCYCACDGAKTLFDIEEVMKKKLIDVGQGVKMSKPLKIKRRLLTGEWNFASLSHQGILAIYVEEDYGKKHNCKRTIQFSNLNNDRQVRVKVEKSSPVGFYDNMVLLLTWEKPLREATVSSVFRNPRIETFRAIEGTGDVSALADVSLLQNRRVLYYPTIYYELFSFNVDTRVVTEINVGKKVHTIASFTGIYCNVELLFRDNLNSVYTLNMNDTVTKVAEGQKFSITALLPLASNPENISNAVFKYSDSLIRNENIIKTEHLIEFGHYSIVRVYKDVFLTYDKSVKSWVLVRIVTP